MLEHVVMIFGLGVFGLLLLIWNNQLEEEHFILKLMLIAMLFLVFTLIGKVALDSGSQHCDYVVTLANQTGNETAYTYEEQCTTGTYDTGLIFWKVVNRLWQFAVLYVLIFGMLFLFHNKFRNWFKQVIGRRRG